MFRIQHYYWNNDMNEEDIEDLSSVYVLIRIVAVNNIDVKVWTKKNYLPQGNYLRSLIQPVITRQISFELTDIEYDEIKYEI